MRELFQKCIPVIIKNEVGNFPNGGYTNDPDDAGGETKWGISKRANPDLDIKNLTREEAEKRYFEKYWKPLNLENIENINIALQIFDFAVNAGINKAVKTAQRLVGVNVDGVIGPNTVAAINKMNNTFLNRYKYARKEYYLYLVKVKPSNNKYLNGWLNRIERTRILDL